MSEYTFDTELFGQPAVVTYNDDNAVPEVTRLAFHAGDDINSPNVWGYLHESMRAIVKDLARDHHTAIVKGELA